MSNLLQKASIITTPTAYNDGKLLSVKPVEYYGPELVTNGDFATDTNWIKQNGWTINASTGKAQATSAPHNSLIFQTSVGTTTVKTFLVTYTVSNYVSGAVKVSGFFGDNDIARNANGTYSIYINKGGGDLALYLATVGVTTLDLDNISVKEVFNADFDFTRGSSATRVGSNGLIQTVASGLPRIDYSGGVGHILTEPERTNLITYSEDFSNAYWDKQTTTVLSNNAISPDGTLNATKLREINNNGFHRIRRNSTISVSPYASIGVFAKAGERDWIKVRESAQTGAYAFFNIKEGYIGEIGITATPKIEYYGNGWYRCSISKNLTSATIGIRVCLSDGVDTYQGDGTSGVYIWGAQLEAGSYPTSYIKSNSGNTTTRLAETLNNSGSADLISSTEGVLYAEISGFSNTDATPRVFSLSDGTGSNRIICFLYNTEVVTNIQKIGQTPVDLRIDLGDIKSSIKLGVKYKTNDFALWINGFEVASSSSGQTYSVGTLDRINFDSGYGIEDFYGKTKSIAVFKEALSDLELECLSSWMSFADMGIALGYTIE